MERNCRSPHANASGTERVRLWLAPGGVGVRAERVGRVWRITNGPRRLVGREYQNISTARHAVMQKGAAA